MTGACLSNVCGILAQLALLQYFGLGKMRCTRQRIVERSEILCRDNFGCMVSVRDIPQRNLLTQTALHQFDGEVQCESTNIDDRPLTPSVVTIDDEDGASSVSNNYVEGNNNRQALLGCRSNRSQIASQTKISGLYDAIDILPRV